ncbi:MAG: ABC transporter substrate-binding protein [Sediminibacterium sp.]
MNRFFLFSFLLFAFSACKNDAVEHIENASWDELIAKAKGSSVTLVMATGSKSVNRYMNEYVLPSMKNQYGITVKIVPGQGKQIVSDLMTEKEAGATVSQADVCWINGETFYQLRQINALYGPYSDRLPNSKYVDYENPVIKYDFQEEVKGFETPWSISSFSVIYDSAKTPVPPVSMQDFEDYWKKHPGKFTIPSDFAGMTLLKSWLIELAGGNNALDGKFDQEKYNRYAPQLWDFINRNKKYFWKTGETFPVNNVTCSQMFASGETDFTLSFNYAEIENKISEGVYAKTCKSLILKAGSIQNTNYMGIVSNSGKKAGALVLCNFLLSPEAQAKKANINYFGARTVLAYNKLPVTDQQRFDTLPKVKYGLTAEELKNRIIKEPVAQYMIILADDFRKKVIEFK